MIVCTAAHPATNAVIIPQEYHIHSADIALFMRVALYTSAQLAGYGVPLWERSRIRTQ